MRQTFTNGKSASPAPKGRLKNTVDYASAESIAVDALQFLSRDEENLLTFLSLSGLQPGEMRQAAAVPGFLASVLDFVSSDERLAAAFAKANGLSPEAMERARFAISGGKTVL
jgi:chromosome segregation ATPase